MKVDPKLIPPEVLDAVENRLSEYFGWTSAARFRARSILAAGLAAWPGADWSKPDPWSKPDRVSLPLTQEASDE